MSLKIAAEIYPKSPSETVKEPLVVVKEYDEDRHKVAVEKLERLCEVGQSGKPSLVTDLMGDPICRIRHFQLHVMLVAEYGEEGEVVGVIRVCVKTVTRGNSVYVKLAYILGLRVSPRHRFYSTLLICYWFACFHLFLHCTFHWSFGCNVHAFQIHTKSTRVIFSFPPSYSAKAKVISEAVFASVLFAIGNSSLFPIPSLSPQFVVCFLGSNLIWTILVQPVHAHYKPISSNVAVLHLPPRLAGSMYNHMFANSEFYPKDIELILSNKLNLGTFMAIPKKYLSKCDPKRGILPPSYAILSVWNTKEVFKLQVKGVSPLAHACCVGTRLLDEWMPWLRLPSFPDVFRPFGVYFLYGLHMEGKCGAQLMKSLCGFVHNMARDDGGCGAIVAELGQMDPVRDAVPHWSKFSWAEDMWCIKNLEDTKKDIQESDWFTSRSSSPVIFVDPRDF